MLFAFKALLMNCGQLESIIISQLYPSKFNKGLKTWFDVGQWECEEEHCPQNMGSKHNIHMRGFHIFKHINDCRSFAREWSTKGDNVQIWRVAYYKDLQIPMKHRPLRKYHIRTYSIKVIEQVE